MQEEIKELKNLYSNLKYELFSNEIPEANEPRISIKGFRGNPELEIWVSNTEEIDLFKNLPSIDLIVLDDIVGIYYENKIYVLLKSTQRMPASYIKRKLENLPLQMHMNYFNNNLSIIIDDTKTLLNDFFSLVRRIRHNFINYSNPIVLTIENYQLINEEKLFEDTRNILNSILFDIYYIYDIMFETDDINSYITDSTPISKGKKPVNCTKLELTYKEYISDLLNILGLLKKSIIYLSNFYVVIIVIEYFMDKSAYFTVSIKVKNLLLKPDFHIKTDHYVAEAINIFKKENQKNTADKTKIHRVLEQFVDLDELKNYLDNINLLSYFKNDMIFYCSKELKLLGLDFENKTQCLSNLTQRIYALRCSIVHSNPDFDETKAVPFTPSIKNFEKLRKELFLISEVARAIILNTAK